MAAIDTGKISSFFSSFASKIKSVVEEEKEYVKTFLSEDKPKEDPKPKANFVLPWLDLPSDHPKLEEIREQILGLTKNKRNFLNAPPEDANFQFNFEDNVELAQACLKANKELENARFFLVPRKISEDKFWRNYFYRIYVIREAYGLNRRDTTEEHLPETTTTQTTAPKEEVKVEEIQTQNRQEEEVKQDDLELEFVSDEYAFIEKDSKKTEWEDELASAEGADWEERLKRELEEQLDT